MTIQLRLRAALRAACFHLIATVLVILLAAGLVFGLWYPFPYRELSGGRDLFFLVVTVDAVCGPLLTLVLFNPAKPRSELWRDLGMVALIQLAALGYGLWTVWEARPLYLVQEIDRFKVIAAPDLQGASTKGLPAALRPAWWFGPLTVAIREPKNLQEGQTVLFESLQGGRDFAQRPDFYVPYEGAAALKSLKKAKPLSVFLDNHRDQQEAAKKLAVNQKEDLSQWFYLPVIARKDWVAVLDPQGQVRGFLRGNGFEP